MEAVMISIPAIIKARSEGGKRRVEVEASNEFIDLEGDQILQKALMDSKKGFLAEGHLDLDHLSEIGHRIGISNPESYIVGRPTEVTDLGKGRTGVVGEIKQAADGVCNPAVNKYDSFWDSLTSTPAVKWRASIYGFPADDGVTDCRLEKCESGALRYVIDKLEWKSLAFTRNPINDDIKGYVKVLKSKDFAVMMVKSGYGVQELPQIGMGSMDGTMGPSPTSVAMSMQPRCMSDMIGQYHSHIRKDCPHADGMNSVAGFKGHFALCCGMSPEAADIHAHALMYHVLLDKRRG